MNEGSRTGLRRMLRGLILWRLPRLGRMVRRHVPEKPTPLTAADPWFQTSLRLEAYGATAHSEKLGRRRARVALEREQYGDASALATSET